MTWSRQQHFDWTGLLMLEQEETRLALLYETLAKGERHHDQAQGIDGETAGSELLS
jgi:hypothetical protein